MFVYLSKKISIPNNVQLRYISWSKADGYIACGGDAGLLKVLKLETSPKDGAKGLAAPSNLSINQNLEGHNGAIRVIVWNEAYQKLTTSDQFGYIIVWMMYKGSWYEEMINNRNKSVVTDMAWNSSGSQICIVYEDGVVIVGSVDGNRLWGKEIKASLLAVEWSPNGKFVLFGLANGEVHAYDCQGNFMSKLHVTLPQSVVENQMIGIEWHCHNTDHNDPHQPSLAFLYRNGAMQLSRHENDQDAVVVQLDKIHRVVCAKWSHSGSIMAVAGQKNDAPEGEQNVVYFISAYGEHLRTLKVPGKEIAGCSWEASSLRIALAVDSHIFFANIRPDYKWGYCGQTVVYSFRRNDRNETGVAFWDTKLDEVYFKYTKDVIAVACYGEYCAVINRADDPNGQYLFQLCNGIGTPVDFKYVDMEPLFVTMTQGYVIAANKDAYYLWQYCVPRKMGRGLDVTVPKRAVGTERLYHVDHVASEGGPPPSVEPKRAFVRTADPICSICASDKVLLIGRESGMLLKLSLPQLTLVQKYSLSSRPMKMAVNCSNSRLAYINMTGILRFFDLEGKGHEVPNFERKDVWDMKWDEDNDQLLAIMEKTRMYVLRGIDAEDPVITSGYICHFRDLTVRTALVDALVASPEHPQKEWIVDVEIKALRDAKQLLEKMNLIEASKYIEKNPHPKLWSLLAEVALNNVDTSLAEHAFVRLKDYAGIQFVKKVNNIQNEPLRKAEIASYFGRFDDAERIYTDCDRRDLALALRRKLGDWFRVLQLLQVGVGTADDVQMEEAWNAVGDYYADRQKWQNAVAHYLPGRNHERLADCYYMLEDYDNLEKLMHTLPDNHKLLPRIGDMFANAGLCQQAVEAFTRCNLVKSALDTCIQLNHWDSAIQLARSYDVPDIDNLLAKYAQQLIGGETEKILTAVQLYRKAGRYLDAAKLVYQIAEEERAKQPGPLRLKKIYVLGALLIEQHHEQNKSKAAAEKGKRNVEAKAALTGLLEEDSVNFMDSRLIDNAWRGAEAYHFYTLAQRQLYQGNVDAAMKTSLHLTEYEDMIDPLAVYSLLALTSCASRQFSVCSRAFIKLESFETLSEEEREAYEKLALAIFTKFSAKDSRPDKAECTGCETLIPDYCQSCPSCDAKFPTCIVTGRPLMDYQFWLCPVCKHRAYEQEIQAHKFCPLCHTAI